MEATSNSPLIRVAIVDDHNVVIEGMERIIEESEIACVSGTGHNIADCLALLKRQQPDVLMLDISLPDGNGIDICPQIRQQYPDVKILMLTSYGELAVIMRALEAGALGYVLKNAMSEEIIEGIRVVASGERFLCDEVELLLKKREEKHITLTGRERELLALVVKGMTNAEIADKMHLGYTTIKGYRRNLVFKLNVHNTAQLVKMALEEKLV